MSNIATGIGLSGKLEYDNSGQLNRLAAERDAAGARQQEQARKDKERADLEKEIQNNSVWSETMQLARNQGTAKELLTTSMANIMEAMQSGDGNMGVIARTELNKVKQQVGSLKNFDTQQQQAFQTALENPDEYQDFNRPVTIGGTEYKNAYEAWNDPRNTPEDVAKAYGGTEHVLVDDPYLGGKVYLPNPQPTVNPLGKIGKFDPAAYTEAWKGSPITGPGQQTYIPIGRKLGQESIDNKMSELLNDAGVVHFYEAQIKREMGPSGGQLKRDADFYEEVGKRLQRDVLPVLQNQVIRDRELPFTPPTPKEDKDSGLANARKILSGGAYSADGNIFQLPFKASFQASKVVGIPAGSTYTTGGSDTVNSVDGNVDIEVKPVRIDFERKSSKGFIVYQSDKNPSGRSPSGATYTYRVPINKQTINGIASLGGSDWESFATTIMENSSKGPVNEIEAWVRSIYGIDPSGTPGAGSSSAPASGYSNVTKVKDAKGNEIEIGVKNGKWYNTSTGQEVK